MVGMVVIKIISIIYVVSMVIIKMIVVMNDTNHLKTVYTRVI